MNYKQILKMGVAVAFIAGTAAAQEEDRLAALEKQMAEASAEIAALKGEQIDLASVTETESKFRFGGYGEIHANWKEGGDDQLDIHRLVMYIGYDFADWIQLNSEIELEHASTDEEYLLIEQLYADFLFGDAFNVRAGRVLAPLGIVNQNHEPTLFNGVERPNVEKYIIPSTWMLDGAGLFGSPLSWMNYEVYAIAGLSNDGFSAKEGVRGGRMKGRPGLNDPAVSGRMDFFPVSTDNQDLRIGVSGYYGGTNNKNKGGEAATGIDNTFSMYSADFEYDISRVQFRGVVAFGEHSDAADLNAGAATPDDMIGEEIFGWYLEAGVSVMPNSWKSGKLAEADLIPFVRYEEYDTQHSLDSGAVASGIYDRTEVTVGANFLLTQNFVVKADAQFCTTEDAGSETVTKYNLGLGWVFN